MRELLKNSTRFLVRRQTSVFSAAVVIMATYALSHLVGLIKTRLLITYFFGAKSTLLDVYFAAFVVPDTLFQLLVIGSLSAAFIPVFTRLLARDESEAWSVASRSLNLLLILFTALSLIAAVFAPSLCRLLAPGFSPDQIFIMTSLLRIMLMAQLFFLVSGFLTGVIQSHQRFLIPALTPVVYNLGIILGIMVLSPFIGIYGPAWGVVIGAFFHLLIQLPLALRLGFRFSPVVDLKNRAVREIIHLMPPRTLALGIDQIEQMVAVSLTSLLAAGSLSILNVARLLSAIPGSLFGLAVGQAALPSLSRLADTPKKEGFITTFCESLLQIAFMAVPVSVMFIVLRIPIVRLVYGAPSFPWAATLLTGKTLAILSLSAVFTAIMQLTIRGFYALHDTRTPLIVGLGAAVFDILLAVSFILFFHLGLPGLAVALSLTNIIETLVLLYLLSRQAEITAPARLTVTLSLLKIALVGLITGVSLWLPMRLLDRFVFDTTRTLPLLALTFISSLVGLGVYIVLSYLFRVEELSLIKVLFHRWNYWRRYFFSTPATPPDPDPV